MAKKARIAGPGIIVNRHAKNGKIEIAFDPSPDGFVTAARRENARLKVLVIPSDGTTDPIELSVQPKIWVFKFESAAIPPHRLAHLEALITEEQDVHIVLEYTPVQDELPFSTAPSKEATEDTEDTETTAMPTGENWGDADPSDEGRATSDPPDAIETHDLPMGRSKNCNIMIRVMRKGGCYRAGWHARLGNYEQASAIPDAQPFETRGDALHDAEERIAEWLVALPVVGDQQKRRDKMLSVLRTYHYEPGPQC